MSELRRRLPGSFPSLDRGKTGTLLKGSKVQRMVSVIGNLIWVAVKELELSYYIGETLLSTIYTHYGNFN